MLSNDQIARISKRSDVRQLRSQCAASRLRDAELSRHQEHARVSLKKLKKALFVVCKKNVFLSFIIAHKFQSATKH